METVSNTEKTPLIGQPDNSLPTQTRTSADEEISEKAGEEEDTSEEDLSHRAIWLQALLHAIFYYFTCLICSSFFGAYFFPGEESPYPVTM